MLCMLTKEKAVSLKEIRFLLSANVLYQRSAPFKVCHKVLKSKHRVANKIATVIGHCFTIWIMIEEFSSCLGDTTIFTTDYTYSKIP